MSDSETVLSAPAPASALAPAEAASPAALSPAASTPDLFTEPPPPPVRKRPSPGERRTQILQALATMLEQPGAERITTATLARKLGVSEAALYRHFASKAQMFDALLEFIEQAVFGLLAQVVPRDPTDAAHGNPEGAQQAARVVALVLQFGEKNPGMARLMVGDALVLEHERLQARMNQFFLRIESTLRQCLQAAALAHQRPQPREDAKVLAGLLTDFLIGRLQRFVRTGFRQMPSEHLQASLALLLH